MALITSLSGINLLAVLVAALVHTVIGLIWFMPKLFGHLWVNLTGGGVLWKHSARGE